MSTLFLLFVATVAMAVAISIVRFLPSSYKPVALIGLALWLTYDGVLGVSGVIANAKIQPPGLFYLLAPTLMLVPFLARSNVGRTIAASIPVWLMTGMESFRLIVEAFLHLLWQHGQLPTMLTYHGANFDILVGATAPVVAWLLASGRISDRMALVWHAMGIALLANVAIRGALTSPGPFKLLATEVPNLAIGTFPFTFIPGLMVPLALVLHVLAIRALRMRMQYAPTASKRKSDAAYPPLQANDSPQAVPQNTPLAEKHPGTAASYQFPNLTARLFIEDMRFSPGDATPGSSAPDSIVCTLEGHPISSRALFAGHMSLIFFGSASCPMTFGSIEPLRDLYEKYGKQVQFVMLAVREAHPGENLTQPQEMEHKLSHACELATSAAAPWKTVVDSIDGALHRALAAKPNAAFLISPDGTILFRALWAGDKTGLDAALADATQGRAVRHPTRAALFRPLLLSLGYFDAILTRSGPQARKDLWHAFPPVAFLAWTTSLFKGLPIAKRGSVAIGVLAGIIVVMINSVTHFPP